MGTPVLGRNDLDRMSPQRYRSVAPSFTNTRQPTSARPAVGPGLSGGGYQTCLLRTNHPAGKKDGIPCAAGREDGVVLLTEDVTIALDED